MKKERLDKHFVKKPYYLGGAEALRSFIKKHKKYPKEAIEQKIEGVVVIKYMINTKGVVIKTKVINGLGFGLDEEAIRLVKLLKFKVPKNRQSKVKFQKSINIHFKLPKKKSKTIQYQLTKKENKATEPKKKASSYTYTINY